MNSVVLFTQLLGNVLSTSTALKMETDVIFGFGFVFSETARAQPGKIENSKNDRLFADSQRESDRHGTLTVLV